MTLNIIADENIPFAREAFSALGRVTTLSGRAMAPAAVRDADILAVRSITKVGPELLDGSSIRFVGTATIGTDHVDLNYLAARGIAFAAAPGSNATSVAEYIVAALLVLARRGGFALAGKSLGVVGVGNVGSRVAARAAALGMTVILNDPPLQRQTGDRRYRPLDEVLQADIVTLHVPLTKTGPDATLHLFDEAMIARLKPGAILLNTSRGAVVDNPALCAALKRGHISQAVLDVWEGEPVINMELLERVALATPHIAGYSFDGKVAGLDMIYQAACRALGATPTWDKSTVLPPADNALIDLRAAGGPSAQTAAVEPLLERAVAVSYPIERDDQALRAVAALPAAERGPFFDRLRKTYPVRREFANYTVRTSTTPVGDLLHRLGFHTAG